MVTEWEDWPPSEVEVERQFQKSVGPFVYVPLEIPADDIPQVLEVPDVG